MKKKLIVGLAVVGALVVLRPVLKHFKQMAAHCKEMMGGHGETPDHEAMRQKMREHCKEMAAKHEQPAEPAVAA